MQLLKFNDKIVDIDDDTAIGITFSSYDVSNPAKKSVNVSNVFSLPKTANNLNIIEHCGDSQSMSKVVYEPLKCNYWIDNYNVIKNGYVRITAIGDRIECFLNEKTDIWERLKNMSWFDFQVEYLAWLQENGNTYSESNNYEVTFGSTDYDDFINEFATNTKYLKLGFFYSNLLNQTETTDYDFIESRNELCLRKNAYIKESYEKVNGGHTSTFIHGIFEFIEDFFDVDFGVKENFANNIFNDLMFKKIYVPVRNIGINSIFLRDSKYGLYFDIFENRFAPDKETKDLKSKTLYDFVIEVFKLFNCVIDTTDITELNTFRIFRFDEIENAEIIELKNKIEKKNFTPFFDKICQINYVEYSTLHEDLPAHYMAKKIVCKNKNLDVDSGSSLVAINAYYPPAFSATIPAPDLSDKKALDNFTFLIDSDKYVGEYLYWLQVQAHTDVINYGLADANSLLSSMKVSGVYDIRGEYSFLEKMYEYPEKYEVEIYMNMHDVLGIKFFKRYFIRELNGYFFINKILGFNPKSKEPTKLELIRIS